MIEKSTVIQAKAAEAVGQDQRWAYVDTTMVGVTEDSNPGSIFGTKGTRRHVATNAHALDWEGGRIRVEQGAICWNVKEISGGPVDLVEIDMGDVAIESSDER